MSTHIQELINYEGGAGLAKVTWFNNPTTEAALEQLGKQFNLNPTTAKGKQALLDFFNSLAKVFAEKEIQQEKIFQIILRLIREDELSRISVQGGRRHRIPIEDEEESEKSAEQLAQEAKQKEEQEKFLQHYIKNAAETVYGTDIKSALKDALKELTQDRSAVLGVKVKPEHEAHYDKTMEGLLKERHNHLATTEQRQENSVKFLGLQDREQLENFQAHFSRSSAVQRQIMMMNPVKVLLEENLGRNPTVREVNSAINNIEKRMANFDSRCEQAQQKFKGVPGTTQIDIMELIKRDPELGSSFYSHVQDPSIPDTFIQTPALEHAAELLPVTLSKEEKAILDKQDEEIDAPVTNSLLAEKRSPSPSPTDISSSPQTIVSLEEKNKNQLK